MDDRQDRYKLNQIVPKSGPRKKRKRKDQQEAPWNRNIAFDSQLHIAISCAMTKLGFESLEEMCVKLNGYGFELDAKYIQNRLNKLDENDEQRQKLIETLKHITNVKKYRYIVKLDDQ